MPIFRQIIKSFARGNVENYFYLLFHFSIYYLVKLWYYL